MLASKNRNEAIVKAYKSGGYSLKEVGLFLDYITQRSVKLQAMQKARPDPRSGPQTNQHRPLKI
jgi:hypothetical protein